MLITQMAKIVEHPQNDILDTRLSPYFRPLSPACFPTASLFLADSAILDQSHVKYELIVLKDETGCTTHEYKF